MKCPAIKRFCMKSFTAPKLKKKEFLKLDFLKVGFYTAGSNYIPLYYESGYYMELCRPHFQTDEISFN